MLVNTQSSRDWAATTFFAEVCVPRVCVFTAIFMSALSLLHDQFSEPLPSSHIDSAATFHHLLFDTNHFSRPILFLSFASLLPAPSSTSSSSSSDHPSSLTRHVHMALTFLSSIRTEFNNRKRIFNHSPYHFFLFYNIFLDSQHTLFRPSCWLLSLYLSSLLLNKYGTQWEGKYATNLNTFRCHPIALMLPLFALCDLIHLSTELAPWEWT